ncbi:MAG TPA: glycosyltransferase [Armatimonadota bacterium]|jgi:glycosyltransferase involved in cell wall biosynthesis|nr:glycosyltransferase [Armatimonadota bacterium]
MTSDRETVVLYLIDALHMRGGTERHLAELAPRIQAHGYLPIVCCLDSSNRDGVGVDIPGVDVRYVDMKRLYTPAGQRLARQIARQALADGVSMVQTFHFKSDWLGVQVARVLQCPLVSSRRDLGFNVTGLRRLILWYINRHADAFIAPSRAVGEAVCRQPGVDPERVHVILNGIDLGAFTEGCDIYEARRWLGCYGDGPVIGMISSLRPIKDHRTLLNAMRAVLYQRPDAKLVLVGAGSEMEPLRELARNLGIEPSVFFTGAREDVRRVLAALDVFVLSTHSEGMSNAIIEAMASGLPVVATDVGGNGECVVDGQTGYLTPHRDAAALADRLLNLINEPEMAREMGERGRRRAVAEFDVNIMVSRTAGLYRRLLKDHIRAVA